MKLSVLTENTAGAYFFAEHGLSYFIEYDNKKILFDAGASDVFLKNAEKLKIDINSADCIVLSHGHWDHGNGLKYLKDKPLICHPDAFQKRYRENENKNIGLELSCDELNEKFDIRISKEPVYISSNIIFLGEIPRINDFESQSTSFVNEKGNKDFVPDDSALAIIIGDELVIVSGCAHSGICNTTEYAKKVTGLKTVKTVIGGFHLIRNDRQTKETIKYFKRNKVKQLLPSHCTQLPALAAFYEEFKINHVKTGMVYKF
ncbi:MAG: MBL fold metallo-hydrolase [Bacteroidales bacterium]|nr:MBL fold metallo-hydrolase [Bacteroidales bacterium]